MDMQRNKEAENLIPGKDDPGRSSGSDVDLVEFIQDAAFAIDRNGYVIAWNKAMEKLTNVRAGDMLGKSDYEYALPFYNERRPLLIDYVLNPSEEIEKNCHSITREGDITIAEVKYDLLNGREFLVKAFIKPVYDHNGEVIGAVEMIRDGSELIVMSKVLKEMEARYSALFDRSLECVYIHDFEGNFIDMNNTLLEVLGYKRGELLSLGFASMIDEEQRPLARSTRDDILTNGFQKGSSIYRVQCKDGEYVYLETKGVLIYKDGKPYAIQGVARDITKSIKTREALRKNEQKYKNIFENVSDFLFIHDLEGDLMETNLAWKTDIGYTAEDVIGMNITDLMPDQYKPLFRDYMNALRAKGRLEGLISIMTKEGRERVVEYKNVLILDEDGNPSYAQGSGRDITERVKAERALKISEEKYRNILENIEDAYFEVDLRGNLTFFNSALANNMGYSSEELSGMSFRQYMDDANAEKVFGMFRDVYATKEPARTFEWEVISKGGDILSVDASISLLKDTRGATIGFRGIARDVTARKEAEKERNRYEMRLAQAQKMEAIGALAGGIAHDFNNMLSAIIGYTELAKAEVEEKSRVRTNLNNVLKAGMRARELVAQILSFGRGFETERKNVQVSLVLKEAFKLLRVTIPTTIEIREIVLCEDSGVFADSTEIHQIIMNLCTNAYQAMEETGGVMNVRLESVELGREGSDGAAGIDLPAGPYIVLEVSDTGCGITEETLAHIFDPFFTTKERGKGTGLGLATVFRIVEELGGRIMVKSALGKGTTFTIHLPHVASKPDDDPGA